MGNARPVQNVRYLHEIKLCKCSFLHEIKAGADRFDEIVQYYTKLHRGKFCDLHPMQLKC